MAAKNAKELEEVTRKFRKLEVEEMKAVNKL